MSGTFAALMGKKKPTVLSTNASTPSASSASTSTTTPAAATPVKATPVKATPSKKKSGGGSSNKAGINTHGSAKNANKGNKRKRSIDESANNVTGGGRKQSGQKNSGGGEPSAKKKRSNNSTNNSNGRARSQSNLSTTVKTVKFDDNIEEDNDNDGDTGDDGDGGDEGTGSGAAKTQDGDEEGDEDEDDEGNAERLEMAAMLEQFTPEQLRRYEHFRRSHLRKPGMRAVMSEVTSLRLSEKLLVTMGGVAKVFAGQLVEMARADMDRTKDNGLIRPRHLRAAFHKMATTGQLPYFKSSKGSLLR